MGPDMTKMKHNVQAWSLWAALVAGFMMTAGCDGKGPNQATGAAVEDKKAQPGVIRVTDEEMRSAGIQTEPVVRSDFHMVRTFPGTVVPNEHALANITTLLRGREVDVYVDLGQEVKSGALLAILYSAELGMAQSSFLKAKAKLYVAERAYQRARSLLEEKVIGLAEAQRREGEMISLRAEEREAQDRLRLLGMTEEHIQQLDRDQKIRSYVPITAPFDSRVIARNLTKGEVVEVTEKLFTVADLSDVWVLANIPEKDIPFIKHQGSSGPSQVVEVLVNAYPDEVFHGKVTYVGDVLDAKTRTMNLRLELPNAERKLKPEMYATIRVYSTPEKDVLAVPESAIQRDRERKFVFVQRDPHTFELREVRLGESDGQMVKILDGLLDGEAVVTKGAFVLKSELLGEQI